MKEQALCHPILRLLPHLKLRWCFCGAPAGPFWLPGRKGFSQFLKKWKIARRAKGLNFEAHWIMGGLYWSRLYKYNLFHFLRDSDHLFRGNQVNLGALAHHPLTRGWQGTSVSFWYVNFPSRCKTKFGNLYFSPARIQTIALCRAGTCPRAVLGLFLAHLRWIHL